MTRVLKVAATLSVRVKVFALDKNPETRATLQQKHRDDWKDADVELVFSDMRTWQPPLQLDIIVSELIGNFGDDECCPECLEAPEKLLRPDGISIPSSCTTYLVPVAATQLCQDVRACSLARRQQMRGFSAGRPHYFGLAASQPVLTFSHGPRRSTDGSVTSRVKEIEFTTSNPGVLHGFVGGFRLLLFEDVELCTLDSRDGLCTPGLCSWGNAFFPLLEPVRLLKEERIRLEVKRLRDARRVWYEWRLLAPKRVRNSMHNLDGHAKSYRLNFASY